MHSEFHHGLHEADLKCAKSRKEVLSRIIPKQQCLNVKELLRNFQIKAGFQDGEAQCGMAFSLLEGE